ncbi:B-box zinc finger protein 20, partial [Ananas comosus]
MKVQCDVCAAEAASVFCCDDEAALCAACDRRVHRANKLAGKHRRFSLLLPSSPPSSSSSSSSSSSQFRAPPLCDICQERRGLLFCREDRAILCRDCDVPIHTASDLAMRHSRFLLTGVRLSSAPLDESARNNGASTAEDGRSPGKVSREIMLAASVAAAEEEAACSNSSSISEYLIKTLPGWRVEEFLTDDAAPAAAANQSYQFFYEGVGLKAEAEAEAEAALRVPQMYNEWRGVGGDNKRSRNCFSN